MIIDLHVHESTFSKDSHISLADIVKAARQRGLDAICITDHDSLEIREKAKQYALEIGFPIFVGVEYYSLDGDLVTFGIDTIPNKRIPAQQYIDYVNSRDGVCYSAHPFRSNNRGLAEKLTIVTGLVGVEVLNANTCDEENNRAIESARLLGMQQLGASDAHKFERVGHYATYFPDVITSEAELVAALKKGLCKAVRWTNEGYRQVD